MFLQAMSCCCSCSSSGGIAFATQLRATAPADLLFDCCCSDRSMSAAGRPLRRTRTVKDAAALPAAVLLPAADSIFDWLVGSAHRAANCGAADAAASLVMHSSRAAAAEPQWSTFGNSSTSVCRAPAWITACNCCCCSGVCLLVEPASQTSSTTLLCDCFSSSDLNSIVSACWAGTENRLPRSKALCRSSSIMVGCSRE